ncbi:MAG: hypothetical protein PHP50_10805 [Lachnospiraceae bacterium]|nr:hypothetical protein [Lachnospiraceae bacterium]
MKKQDRIQKIKQIRENCEPVARAKDYAMEHIILRFGADKFSIYAIAYADKIVKPAPGPSAPAGDSNPDHSDDSDDSSSDIPVTPAETPVVMPVSPNETPSVSGKIPNASGMTSPDSKPQTGKEEEKATTGAGDSSTDNKTPASTETVKKPETRTAQITSDIPQKEKAQLDNAVSEIKEIAPSIQPGPYVKLPEDAAETTDENGNAIFTVEIPADLLADGRTFYLVTTDSNGNVVVLLNESIENGVISVTGDPNATYQII